MRTHTNTFITILALGVVVFTANVALAEGGHGPEEAMGHLNAAISHAKGAVMHGGEGHPGEVSKHAAEAIAHGEIVGHIRCHSHLFRRCAWLSV